VNAEVKPVLLTAFAQKKYVVPAAKPSCSPKDIVDIAQASFQVRLNRAEGRVNLVENVSEMAKRFIDMYDQLPSEISVNRIREIQDQILFGERGIFDIGIERKGKEGQFEKIDNYNLMQPRFKDVRDAIRSRLIDPLNRYLKYNQGVETDAAGVQSRATIQNYNDAYLNLYRNSLDLSKSGNWGISKRIDIKPGLEQAIRYFDSSQNPYDIAMRELHSVHMESSALREQGSVGKGYKTSDEIADYINNGFIDDASIDITTKQNRIFNMALNEYVKDESRMLSLVDLAKKERTLKIELENRQRFVKNAEENTEIRSLQGKLARVQEIKTDMEAAVSYMFSKNDPLYPPETVFFRPGKRLTNFEQVPYVILSNKGKIKEVVKANNTSRSLLSPSDKVVKNGRRYEITDGEQQQGLRVLSEAFGGNPRITDNLGNVKTFSTYELRNFIDKDFKRIRAEVIGLGAELASKEFKSREDFANYSIRRKVALFDGLFKNMKDPSYTKALILRMLTPEISDKIVSVRNIGGLGGNKAQFDYMYLENKLSEPVMSLLTDLASGEYKPDYMLKDFANEILNDITIMKNAAFVASKNRNIDIDLLTSRMYTEPASLKGYLTQEKMISQDVYDRLESTDANVRDAARVLYNHATGTLVDPVVLYKSTKVLEANGVESNRIWGKEDMATNSDGSIRRFGQKKIFVSEVDAINRKDLGDGGGMKESTASMVKNKLDCLRNN